MQEAKYQLDLLQKYLQPGRLFDVGAAGGFFMKASDRGWQVVGHEISLTAIQWAAAIWSGNNVWFLGRAKTSSKIL